MEDSIVNIGLWISYIMLIIGAAGAIIMPLVNAASQPKVLMKGGIGLLVLIVVYLIGWALAGSEVTNAYLEEDVDASMSKQIGGVLTMMYILLGVALVGIVYSEISKAIK